ncbi:branched-chain amino acid ABC transporter permease [Leisingera thetidis]|uniref:branched-chain amino acid ABC transporter permease n=1 Tax=Leisingera thetidis TaxID=2930199 RepID=UPI0021F69E95|nr:branched-chain amino acid ABC transporter permease [Leisingera thetidis]
MHKAILSDKTVRLTAFALLALAAAGLMLPAWVVNNMMFGLARGAAVLGLLVLWRTGLMSFGHGLYFGLGAYAVALSEQWLGLSDFALRIIIAMLAAVIAGFALGFILRRYRDIFFAMLSLAFSMVLYGILVKTEALGSTDGFSVSQTTFLGWAPEGKQVLFTAIIAVCLTLAVLVQMYLRSTLGRLTTAIRDNEIRVEYLGYSVSQAIHIKYVISAALAGAAGGMMAMALGQVDPDSMVYWTVSGELVFITIMAGPGSVLAPFIGAIIFEFLRTYAFEIAPHAWQLIVGGTLLLIIFFLPGGIWSLLERIPLIRRLRHD